MDSWLRGVGCVPLYNLMEDAATAEISRLCRLCRSIEPAFYDGRTIDVNMVRQTIAAETERRMIRAGSVIYKLNSPIVGTIKGLSDDKVFFLESNLAGRKERCPKLIHQVYVFDTFILSFGVQLLAELQIYTG
uniref:Malate synthase C-terminal domain-containing protein n=1 Tax=Parascaris equorum TaxID=6256 RepID=A0A914RFY8_PAREQ